MASLLERDIVVVREYVQDVKQQRGARDERIEAGEISLAGSKGGGAAGEASG
jgi:hypothetical protein